MTSTIKKALQAIGLDRAIGAATLTQMLRFITGPITMVALIQYMSPEEQGFYYSFAGVMGIQVFLEAGFGQSITQFSSKEFAKLRFNHNGLLTGDTASLSRLRSIFHKANRYYTLMAGILALGLAVGGFWFFSTKESHGVPWQIPWLICSFCAGLGFIITPFWSVLEGCNRVADVAVYRLWVTLGGFFTTIIALSMGLGIHVATVGAIVSTMFPFLYLFFKWRPFLYQICRKPGDHQVSWKKDIWGFQLRIATTWIAGYALTSLIPVLAFQYAGAVVAGQAGMTLNLARTGCGLATIWTVTKLPEMGSLQALGRQIEFERIWKFGCVRHLTTAFLYQFLLIIGIIVAGIYLPTVANRMLPISSSLGMSLGYLAGSIILIYSHYTRACRREPFAKIMSGMAVSFLILSVCFSPHFGILAITSSFALVHIVAAATCRKIWRDEKKVIWHNECN